MTKRPTSKLYDRLMAIGFMLFFFGIFCTTVLSDTKLFQIMGIVLLITASAVFGAAIRAQRGDAKK